MIQKNIKIQIPTGLEARPVAVLVQIASKYESSIFMGMMALGLEADEEITVIADGKDEEKAIKGIEEFITSAK